MNTNNTAPEFLPETAEDAAHVQLGSDRYSVTIVARSKSGHKISVRYDRAVPGEGHDYFNGQRWLFQANPEGEIEHFFRNKMGVYRKGSARLFTGRRSHRSDPSF